MANKSFINGPVYEVAKFGTQYLNVPPVKHRLYNAIGLMAGLYIGRKVMDILAGQTPEGRPIDKDDLISPFKLLHGLLAYDHFSDDPKMRWMRVADQMIPGVLGGLGAVGGSFLFFREPYALMSKTVSKLNASQFMLQHAEQTALFQQFKVLSRLAGIAAVPGSASGFGVLPSTLNYSTVLSGAFAAGAERNSGAGLPVIRELFNGYSSFPQRWHRLIPKIKDYLEHNPSPTPEALEEMLSGMVKPLFNHASPKQMEAIKDMVLDWRKFSKDAQHSLADLHAASLSDVKKHLDRVIAQAPNDKIGKKIITLKERLVVDANRIIIQKLPAKETEKRVTDLVRKSLSMEKLVFNDLGFEKLLIDAGLDPREAAIGDMGTLSTLARWCGKILRPQTEKEAEATHKLLVEGLELRHPELKEKAFDPKAYQHAQSTIRKGTAAALLGVSAGSIGMIALSKDAEMADLKGSMSHAHVSNDNAPSSRRHHVHAKRNHGLVNGKILDTAEGITGMIQAGIGAHRVHCAMGLTVGSWLGDRVMDALTGVSFAGKKIPREDIWEPLQKLHGILAFNPHSDLPKDKWMQVLRWGVPGVMGAVAVLQGSRMFFEKRHGKIKKAEYLDEVEDKATFAQSTPWSYTSAVSSLFGSAAGLQILPLGNYATSLGTRYSMASGRKVSLPVVGKLWSNNSTLFPYGPSGMLDLLIRESVNNKGFDPELLETYTIGILKPWFKNVTPEQIEKFVMEVHRVRDKFFQEGGVPEAMKTQLEKELKAHFRGAGLEHTLEHIGLNPMKATLAENGWSGAIANTLGARSAVEKIKKEYKDNYTHRLEAERHSGAGAAPHK